MDDLQLWNPGHAGYACARAMTTFSDSKYRTDAALLTDGPDQRHPGQPCQTLATYAYSGGTAPAALQSWLRRGRRHAGPTATTPRSRWRAPRFRLTVTWQAASRRRRSAYAHRKIADHPEPNEHAHASPACDRQGFFIDRGSWSRPWVALVCNALAIVPGLFADLGGLPPQRATSGRATASFGGRGSGSYLIDHDLPWWRGYGINSATYLGCAVNGHRPAGGAGRIGPFTLAPVQNQLWKSTPSTPTRSRSWRAAPT